MPNNNNNINPSKSLVVYQSTNRKGRHDATGAFKPEALAFQRLHNIPNANTLPIDHGVAAVDKARLVLNRMDKFKPGELDAFVYFGHGTTVSMPSMGFGKKFSGVRDAGNLASSISRAGSANVIVVLYACLTGKGFGIADWLGDELRDRLGKTNARVIAHLGAGHTTKFPFAEYSGEGAGDNGIPIISRSDPLWGKWCDKLQKDQSFRLSFPFLTQNEVKGRLR